jgi:predicted phosphodiesterase
MSDPRILVIGDTHLPATKQGYFNFCKAVELKYGCNEVIHIGDLVDFHSISYHEHDPAVPSISDELKRVRTELKKVIRLFPKMRICLGNHDLLIYRKAKTHGLFKEFFKSMNQILDVPDEWIFDNEFNINGVKYFHGTGYSGKYPHAIAASIHRQNCVIGHCHSVCGIEYMACKKDLIWGMSVGSGIDDKQIVFEYGQDTPRKSVISCGVVINGSPQIITVKL